MSDALDVIDPIKFEPSPTLMERIVAKQNKYERLIMVAQRQAKEKKRKQAPGFVAFAVSDYGEMSPVSMDLQDWMVSQCE